MIIIVFSFIFQIFGYQQQNISVIKIFWLDFVLEKYHSEINKQKKKTEKVEGKRRKKEKIRAEEN